MIIEMLISLVINLLAFILPFELPALPDEVMGYLEVLVDALSVGAGILSNFVALDYIFLLFSLLLALDAFFAVYKFVMWVIRKIPMLNIK